MYLMFFLMLPILVNAGSGVGLTCCELALQSSAYVDKTIPHDNYKCGQRYGLNLPPAPELSVPTSWCRKICTGYALSPPDDTAAWANPLVQYILPAVLFSMTIPRRLVLEPSKWFFDFNPQKLNGLTKALFSLCIAGAIVILDTALWIFMIMVAPGPFIFSGLVEAVLDYRVIQNLLGGHIPRGEDRAQVLDRGERAQLLTAVLAGNLGIEETPADPQKELWMALDVYKRPEEVEVRLRAMLACQYPFGAAVGGPILFYIGAFVYTIADLHDAEGDHETARALAFGIWWMNIVHVAVISGLLLASNNPSTAAAMVSLRKIKLSLQERLGFAEKRIEMEDRIQARLEAYSRLSLAYRARYEPVWMWNRGKSKFEWLRRTKAWEKHWFRERIEMTIPTWIFLALVAYSLILFPSALAFWIEYNTPPAGPGCRSMTILSWACAQSTFVILSAWSHFKASHENEYWLSHSWLNRLRRKWAGVVIATIFLLPAWIVAVFTTFAGTLMQITGIYQNCICSSTGYWSFPSGSTVALASDTEYDRHSSGHWTRAGYAALIFLACVTYLGWWSQRYLREKFIERVKHLVDDRSSRYPVDPATTLPPLQTPDDLKLSNSELLRYKKISDLSNGTHEV